MILPDDIHCLQNDVSDTSTSPLKIPNQLISGVCTIDQLHPTIEDDQLREPLISSLHSIQTVTWEQVQTATYSDDSMLLLISNIEDGIPDSKHLSIREYHPFRKHLYCIDGVILYKDRIIVPPSLRPSCLSALHAAHQDINHDIKS